MAWGTLTVGRLGLKETYTLAEGIDSSTGQVSLVLNGQEHTPSIGLTTADIQAKQQDVLALLDKVVPVTFSVKSDKNGYYRVVSADSDQLRWPDAMATRWNLGLLRLGYDNTADIESRLSNVVRLNDFGQTGVRWHGPSIGHYGYFTGSTSPSGSVTRTGANGAHVVWLGVPASITPRWGCAVTAFLAGRVRFVSGTIERTATGFNQANTGWTLDNGLVRVSPLAANGVIRVESHDGTQWEAKDWHIAKGGATTSLGIPESITVIRNDPEVVVVRLMKNGSPGRTLVDLTLKRGSRFVEVYIQTNASATLGAYLHTNEAHTDFSASGYMVATANDAAGNKAACGSARTFTANLNGGLSKAAVTAMDLWIGSVVGGTGAVAGDIATDLRDQYIASMPEVTWVVDR